MDAAHSMWTFAVLITFFLAFRHAVALNDTGLGEGEVGNWPKEVVTVVGGYVYCHDCAHNGSRWIKSLPSALVSVLCKDKKTHNVTSYGAARTNAKGYYQVKLPHHNPLRQGIANCKVHLLVSTDEKCNVVTNTGNGKVGANLLLRKAYYNELFFRAAPMAFTPYYCDHRGPKK
ncbi:hypothetical protein O6H91_04G100900 [Diphasiastrum complanatum]|uniref:Uncharacterized protein n=1 Tax=Diphasiastrum complanatum TaxID=34168 RepID=A0ACC2DZY4_DIPCM|nr:hypothetical protein O6H91_04G100900 [Diphasiastrum complanatum]